MSDTAHGLRLTENDKGAIVDSSSRQFLWLYEQIEDRQAVAVFFVWKQ